MQKTCGEFIKRLDFGGDLFNSPKANSIKYHIKNFQKAQELGRLKDISNFYFKYYDVNNIECLEEQLDYYRDLYHDSDSLEFNQEYYELYVDNNYPGFKELFGLVSLLNDKLKKENPNIRFDSDSDSE